MFCVFITVFGEKELQVLCQGFAEVLQHAGVASEQVQTEWVMLKSHLYNKWV